MKMIEIKIKEHGRIQIQLDEIIAPIAVGSVLKLIEKGTYNNRAIERLEKDFVIQPNFYDEGDFAGLIEPEFKINEMNHKMEFAKGTVAMAGDENNSSDSQFFITIQPRDYLKGNFTIIGQVISGFDEIERLNNVELIERLDKQSGRSYHQPKEKEIIESIQIMK